MKALILAAASITCACVAGTPGGGASYTLPSGPADYISLKSATDKCRAEGGQIELKNGYDRQELSSYTCKIGGAR